MIEDVLLKLFGCWCDPNQAREVPVKEKKERPPIAGNHFGKNVRFRDGKTFKTEYTTDGLVETEESIGRTGKQTDGDEYIFTLPAWSDKGEETIKKYFQLKPYWAKGLSAKQTARAFNGKYGYGERTLEKFWSAYFDSLSFDFHKNKN